MNWKKLIKEDPKNVVKVRKLLSLIEKDEKKIRLIVDQDVLPNLTQLSISEYAEIKFEAIWCLINLTGIDCVNEKVCDYLMRHEINNTPYHAILTKMVEEETNSHVKSHALWIITNICSESVVYRNTFISNGICTIIKTLLENPKREIVLYAILCYSQMCRFGLHKEIQKLFPTIYLLTYTQDPAILKGFLWSIAFITKWKNFDQIVQTLIRKNVLKRVFECIDHRQEVIIEPALNIIGKLSCMDDLILNYMIQHNVLEKLKKLLEKDVMVHRVCWILSNFACGTEEQIDKLFKCGIVDKMLIHSRHKDLEIQEQCAWFFSNLIIKVFDIKLIDSYNFVAEFQKMKSNGNTEMVRICEEALKLIEARRNKFILVAK